MSGIDYPAWYDDGPRVRRTLIVEIQPDAEDVAHAEDREVFTYDVTSALAANFGVVVNSQWVEHDDKEEI